MVKVIRSEEERFDAVLTGGLPRLEEALERAASTTKVLSGDEAFKLYDTYGLPRDFIEDLAGNVGLRFDAEGFDAAMEGQRVKARAGSAFEGKKGEEFAFASEEARESLRQAGDSFEGYTDIHLQGIPVLALFNTSKKAVDALNDGDSGYAVLARTPFYVEAGGQVSDQGWLDTGSGRSRVSGVVRLGPGLPRAHRVEKVEGRLAVRDLIGAEVDATLRDATRRNHTATHLLHAALRKVLGPHVKQAGSLVAPDRLRFDFVHFSALTQDELLQVERLVNEARPRERAGQHRRPQHAGCHRVRRDGAVRREVRRSRCGWWRSATARSAPSCAAARTCAATGDIGAVLDHRRIRRGRGRPPHRSRYRTWRVRLARKSIDELEDVAEVAGTRGSKLSLWVATQSADRFRKAQKEIQQLKTKLALGGGGGAAQDDSITIAGATLIARQVADVDAESLRTLADTLKSRLKSGVVVLAAALPDGKVSLVVTVTPDLAKKAPAGQLVKTLAPIVGGGGGGRPDFAQAGGKDASKITELLATAQKQITELLG